MRSGLQFFLFGKFHVQNGSSTLSGLDTRKSQELFCYLLLNRDRPHARESLASLLWGDHTTAQSRKYLRQALWQMQTALDEHDQGASQSLLLVDQDWIQLNLHTPYWLDVAAFEGAVTTAQGIPGRQLSDAHAQSLREAVELYRGDLLEGWYHDWNLYERERLQNMYLTALGKIAGYLEAHGEYEAGMSYATRILRYDRAHERTHRRLMRLQYLAGNRTAALRQYEICVQVLDQELGVGPTDSTQQLYQQIRRDHLDDRPQEPAPAACSCDQDPGALSDVLDRLGQLQETLASVQTQIQREIRTVQRLTQAEH